MFCLDLVICTKLTSFLLLFDVRSCNHFRKCILCNICLRIRLKILIKYLGLKPNFFIGRCIFLNQKILMEQDVCLASLGLKIEQSDFVKFVHLV